MNKIKQISVILVAIMMALMFSCKKENNIIDKKEKTEAIKKSNSLSIPFETEESLKSSNATSLDQNAEIVHYKVMRNFAIQDFVSEFKSILEYDGDFSFSEFPIIIYDYNSKPKYYEFIVFQQGVPKATITTFAQKNTDDVVAFALPFVRDFSLYNPTDDFFEGEYPNNPYTGIVNAYGSIASNLFDNDSEASVEPLPIDDIEKLSDLYNFLPSEDIEEINLNGGISEIEAEISTERTDGQTFWAEEFPNFNSLIEESDEEIILKAETGKTTATTYKTPHYYNTNLKKTRWSVDCGPAVTAWVFRGFYSNYNGIHVRIHGNSQTQNFRISNITNTSRWDFWNATSVSSLRNEMGNQDGGLLADIYDEGNTKWNGVLAGMTWPSGMNKALKSVTNNNYKFSYTSNIYKHIKKQ